MGNGTLFTRSRKEVFNMNNRKLIEKIADFLYDGGYLGDHLARKDFISECLELADTYLDDISPDDTDIDVDSITTRIINLWDSFAKMKANPHFNVIQREISTLIISNDITEAQITKGIINYQNALKVPDTLAYEDFQMARWLSKNFMESYIDGKFDINNYNPKRFNPNRFENSKPVDDARCAHCRNVATKNQVNQRGKRVYLCDECFTNFRKITKVGWGYMPLAKITKVVEMGKAQR